MDADAEMGGVSVSKFVPLVLVCTGTAEMALAERVLGDLRKRGLSAFHAEPNTMLSHPDHWAVFAMRVEVVVIVPDSDLDSSVHLDLYSRYVRTLPTDVHPILVLPYSVPLPEVVTVDRCKDVVRYAAPGHDYDYIFGRIYSALVAPMPEWIEMRLRPSAIEAPTGVTWWSEDLVVADEYFGHIVQGNDLTNILVTGLSSPHQLTLDREELVVADRGNNQIVTSEIVSGAASSFGSERKACGRSFLHPNGVAQHRGRMAIADTDNHRVVFSRAPERGRQRRKWEDVDVGSSYSFPCGVELTDDMIWIADTFNHRIVGIEQSLDGRPVEYGNYGWGLSDLTYPVGIVPWRDYLFVAEAGPKRIHVLRVSGAEQERSISDVASSFCGAWIRDPFDMSISRADRLAVTDRAHRCVWLVSLEPALEAHGVF